MLEQVTVQRSDVERLYALASPRGGELSEVATRLASRPFGESTAQLADSIDAWAARQSKSVRLELSGREMAVPRALSNVLPGILIHLVRNALSHGIEPPTERRAAGKPETGTIRIGCEESRFGPEVHVEDDGRGFDADALTARAREIGSSKAGLDAALEPGVSTLERSGDRGGYGVGLAAIVVELDSIGYELSIESTPNVGSRMIIRRRRENDQRSA